MTAGQKRGSSKSESVPLSEAELAALAELPTDRDAVLGLLPEEDRRRYEECRNSVVEARRYAERNAHLVVDRMSTPTLREAILAAQHLIDTATEERNRLLGEAREKGVSLRALGKLVGKAPSTIMEWTGGAGEDGDDALDRPVGS